MCSFSLLEGKPCPELFLRWIHPRSLNITGTPSIYSALRECTNMQHPAQTVVPISNLITCPWLLSSRMLSSMTFILPLLISTSSPAYYGDLPSPLMLDSIHFWVWVPWLLQLRDRPPQPLSPPFLAPWSLLGERINIWFWSPRFSQLRSWMVEHFNEFGIILWSHWAELTLKISCMIF